MKARQLKIIISDTNDPYLNLAAEEYMTRNAEEGVMTLYLWQNARTIVIGKNQNPWRECDVEAIKRDGIRLARRISGGGAVYHDMGNLNFTFIARDDLFDISRQTDVILKACQQIGVDAEKNGRNDLTVDGRKFSGHAYYSSQGHNYHHGTIMMDVNSDDLSKYLTVSAEKLKSKGVASVRSRVTNLREHVGTELETAATETLIRSMRDAMVSSAEDEYGCIAEFCPYPEVPKELLEKYSSEEWRLGDRIPFEIELTHRFDWGDTQVLLSMKGACIKTCRIFSDSLDTEMFGAVEALLTGCKYDAESIRALAHAEAITDASRELIEFIAMSVA